MEKVETFELAGKIVTPVKCKKFVCTECAFENNTLSFCYDVDRDVPSDKHCVKGYIYKEVKTQ